MNDQTPSPNEATPLQEVGDTLRPAVEQVRAAAPPTEGVERSIDRAQSLGPPLRRRSRRWLGAMAAAGVAAVVLVGFGLWPGRLQERESPEEVAWNQANESNSNVPAKRMRDGTSNRIMFEERGSPVSKDDRPRRSLPAGVRDAQGTALPPGMMPPLHKSMPNGSFGGGSNVDRRGGRGGMGLAGIGGIAGLGGQGFNNVGVNGNGMQGNMQGAANQGVGGGVAGFGGMMSGSGMAMMGGMMGRSGMAMMGGMMGMGGGMPATDGTPTRALQGALKKAQTDLYFRKAQVERFEELSKNGSIDPRLVDEQKERFQAAEKRLKAVQRQIAATKSQAGDKLADKGPHVWHRDRSRPTFARVYVGGGNSLEMVSLNVSVTIEGPRARTVVDHIFRNPHNQQLEGTFEYPLPSGASPSYFAMFLGQTRDTVPVRFNRRGGNAPLPAEALARLTPAELVKQVDTTDWGRLQEARIVSKEKALETYEEVVRGRIDPALLEYAGGNTFSGRVFPILAKGYNRVILAYEELLPVAQEQMLYRFPLPGRKLNELQFTLQAKADECLKSSFLPKDAKKDESGGRITFARIWKDSKPEGEVLFAYTPANAEAQAISGQQGDNGPRYLYARLRPRLKTVAKEQAFASHAVFLLDTSLSEHPERFAVNMKLLQKILETDKAIKHFNILTFNVGAAWVEPKDWIDNTSAGRAKAMKTLDGLVLEGATDISCALDKLAQPGFDIAAGTNLNVFLLSDGHITWGEPDVAALVARFEQRCPTPARFHCYRTGLGEENGELFAALTRKGGGVFQCFGEADLQAAAQAHRSQCLQVRRVRFVGGPEASDILVSGRRAAVYPDGELVVAARFNGTGRTTVILEGEFAGEKMVQEFPLDVRSGSELAPRAWAEVAVASLLSLHDSNLDTVVTAYCQQFGIVSRAASFLVLENEADYKRFNLEEERGKTLAGDLGVFVADMWTRLGKAVPASKAFERFLTQIDKRVNLLNGPNGAHVRQMLGLLKEADFELPVESVRGGLIHEKDKDMADYLGARERDRRNANVYLKEARRRAESEDVDGAIRVLSSIIEENPSRGDALRLVGYRLVDLQQPAQAARLFSQVRKQRPFEPHSYRDLAHALEESGQYGLAAVNYEIVLAGAWHNRFRQELKVVAQEEYAHMMQDAIRRQKVSRHLADQFGERLEQMARPQPKSDLRATISWNTDATDIDLWVIEPDGTKCFYSHNRTASGGELSQDQTRGYGPERYQIAKAQPGVYTIIVHYFAVNPNLLGSETHVNVNVTRFAGTPKETSQRHTVILKRHNEQVEVCKIKF